MNKKPIVVIGGGFGGIYTIKDLLKQGERVVLISTSQHFTFTPLLHEVATGSLMSHDIAFEYESFFRSDLFEFVSGSVTRIDPESMCVWIGETCIAYDRLVIATGSRTNEHLVKGMEYVYELKRVEDAVAIKHAVITKAQHVEKHVSVSVIGGGPTGCELVFEIKRLLLALKKRHPTLVFQVRLIHSKKDLGGSTRSDMQTYISNRIKHSGIEVVYDALAEEVTTTQVITNKGTFVSDVTILATGVRPNTDVFQGVLPLDAKGSLLVEPTLQVVGHPNIFALGDIIQLGKSFIPRLAQTAVQQASIVAKNIQYQEQGKPLQSYEMKLKGYLLSLGYGDGAGEMLGFFIKGALAWFLWRTVYLFKTPGFKNKIRVAVSWTIDLFQGRDLTTF